MKKIFLIASLALLPLTANAQSGRDQVIQAAADELKPAFCSNDFKKAIQIVEDCYVKVDEDSEKNNMNQCVIEDSLVIGVALGVKKRYINNLQADPYANLDFVDMTNFMKRVSKHPNFMSDVQNHSWQEAGKEAFMKTASILEKENCFNLDKFK